MRNYTGSWTELADWRRSRSRSRTVPSNVLQEFVELMIKRESEKETPEDLKQVFRVFDKVGEGG